MLKAWLVLIAIPLIALVYHVATGQFVGWDILKIAGITLLFAMVGGFFSRNAAPWPHHRDGRPWDRRDCPTHYSVPAKGGYRCYNCGKY